MKILLLTKLVSRPLGAFIYFQDIMDLAVFGPNDWVDPSYLHPSAIDFSEYDLAISYFYPYVIPKKKLDQLKYGAINCHISLLPFNGGAHPNVHAIIDNTPIGVAIHKIDGGIDTGNILYQSRLESSETDTGKTLYDRLRAEMIRGFREFWPILKEFIVDNNRLPDGLPQDPEEGSYHYKSDVDQYDDLEGYFGEQTAHEFVDILRARTFDNYPSAYIRDTDGKKIYVRVQLSYE